MNRYQGGRPRREADLTHREGRTILGTQALILFVAAILAGLYGLDRFLASLESRELANEARTHYRRGAALLAAGKAADAATELRRAHVLARKDRGYQLSLARALAAAGALEPAEQNLRALLEDDSNDGAANLEMARLQARQGIAAEADAYYHRALYGTWARPQDTRPVRLELAEFLASKGLRKELLAELLLLRDDTDGRASTSLEVARLYLAAGSPERAADAYRALVRRDPGNVDAYAGIGEAELRLGKFRAAGASFLDALKRKPGDPELIRRLHLTTTLSSLDPTPRRLTSREKFERSVTILAMVEDDLLRCTKDRAMPSDVQALLNSADRARNLPLKGPATNEFSESRLSLAERLWEARGAACGPPDSNEDPLPLLMHVLNQ